MKKLPPITLEKFVSHFKIERKIDLAAQLQAYYALLESIQPHAFSPFYWIIADNHTMKLEDVSDTVAQLTPFSKEEWLASDAAFYTNQFHPEDRNYTMAAFQQASILFANMDEQARKHSSFNFYTRMLDKNNKYRWVLIQTTLQFINDHKQLESSLSVTYDLSNFSITSLPPLSIIDSNNHETTYYKYEEEKIKEIHIEPIHITSREKEILRLMARGLNTPKISEQLFISYHTVENHKRNLRKKTDTKTSAALIAYAITHNILAM